MNGLVPNAMTVSGVQDEPFGWQRGSQARVVDACSCMSVGCSDYKLPRRENYALLGQSYFTGGGRSKGGDKRVCVGRTTNAVCHAYTCKGEGREHTCKHASCVVICNKKKKKKASKGWKPAVTRPKNFRQQSRRENKIFIYI